MKAGRQTDRQAGTGRSDRQSERKLHLPREKWESWYANNGERGTHTTNQQSKWMAPTVAANRSLHFARQSHSATSQFWMLNAASTPLLTEINHWLTLGWRFAIFFVLFIMRFHRHSARTTAAADSNSQIAYNYHQWHSVVVVVVVVVGTFSPALMHFDCAYPEDSSTQTHSYTDRQH